MIQRAFFISLRTNIHKYHKFIIFNLKCVSLSQRKNGNDYYEVWKVGEHVKLHLRIINFQNLDLDMRTISVWAPQHRHEDHLSLGPSTWT